MKSIKYLLVFLGLCVISLFFSYNVFALSSGNSSDLPYLPLDTSNNQYNFSYNGLSLSVEFSNGNVIFCVDDVVLATNQRWA